MCSVHAEHSATTQAYLETMTQESIISRASMKISRFLKEINHGDKVERISVTMMIELSF